MLNIATPSLYTYLMQKPRSLADTIIMFLVYHPYLQDIGPYFFGCIDSQAGTFAICLFSTFLTSFTTSLVNYYRNNF